MTRRTWLFVNFALLAAVIGAGWFAATAPQLARPAIAPHGDVDLDREAPPSPLTPVVRTAGDAGEFLTRRRLFTTVVPRDETPPTVVSGIGTQPWAELADAISLTRDAPRRDIREESPIARSVLDALPAPSVDEAEDARGGDPDPARVRIALGPAAPEVVQFFTWRSMSYDAREPASDESVAAPSPSQAEPAVGDAQLADAAPAPDRTPDDEVPEEITADAPAESAVASESDATTAVDETAEAPADAAEAETETAAATPEPASPAPASAAPATPAPAAPAPARTGPPLLEFENTVSTEDFVAPTDGDLARLRRGFVEVTAEATQLPPPGGASAAAPSGDAALASAPAETAAGTPVADDGTLEGLVASAAPAASSAAPLRVEPPRRPPARLSPVLLAETEPEPQPEVEAPTEVAAVTPAAPRPTQRPPLDRLATQRIEAAATTVVDPSERVEVAEGMILLGVYSSRGRERALVRTIDGAVRVELGDEINGWRVVTISDASVQLRRGAQSRQLRLP